MQDTRPVISVVSPVYGCKNCLEDLVDRISASLTHRGEAFEVILVDDASPDGAWARILELTVTRPWLNGIRLSRNFGQHYAIAAGIENSRGELIIVMDCDLQDVPEEIPRLLDAVNGDTEVVLGRRIDRQDHALKRLGSWGFYRLLGWLTDTPYDHTTGNFGVYSRKVIDTVNQMPEADRFFPLLVRWTGYRIAYVTVTHEKRGEGQSGYSFPALLRLATNVALSFSDKPLRLVVKLGLAFSGFAMFFVGYSLYRYAKGDIQVAGFTSILASIWLLGSVILCSTGIVGLYVGRLYSNAKKRPHYVVSEQSQDDH